MATRAALLALCTSGVLQGVLSTLVALPPFVSAQGTLERYPASDWRAVVSAEGAAELKLLAGSSWRCPRPKYSVELIVMRLHVSATAPSPAAANTAASRRHYLPRVLVSLGDNS